MAKTLISDPIQGPQFFKWVLPLLVVKQCSKVSSYWIYRKTNDQNMKKKDKKPNFGTNFGPIGQNLGPRIFCSRFYLY